MTNISLPYYNFYILSQCHTVTLLIRFRVLASDGLFVNNYFVEANCYFVTSGKNCRHQKFIGIAHTHHNTPHQYKNLFDETGAIPIVIFSRDAIFFSTGHICTARHKLQRHDHLAPVISATGHEYRRFHQHAKLIFGQAITSPSICLVSHHFVLAKPSSALVCLFDAEMLVPDSFTTAGCTRE